MLNNKRVLCIGSNLPIIDELTTNLAKQNSSNNHGLITQLNFIPAENGFYHTSLADLGNTTNMVNLAKHFHHVIYTPT